MFSWDVEDIDVKKKKERRVLMMNGVIKVYKPEALTRNCNAPVQCWSAVAWLHRPEPDDGAFLADVALGLVLGGLSSSHAVQDGQPHHRLRLQAHPVQEHGSLQLGFIVGLDTETDKTLNGVKELEDISDGVLSLIYKQKYIYSDFYHGSIFIFILKDKSDRILLFLQTNLI